jgi:hypothetical protein
MFVIVAKLTMTIQKTLTSNETCLLAKCIRDKHPMF